MLKLKTLTQRVVMCHTSSENNCSLCILGGEQLYESEDYIVALVTHDRLRLLADALASVTPQFIAERYWAMPDDYQQPKSDEDCQYTWDWFSDFPPSSIGQRGLDATSSFRLISNHEVQFLTSDNGSVTLDREQEIELIRRLCHLYQHDSRYKDLKLWAATRGWLKRHVDVDIDVPDSVPIGEF